MVQHFYCPKTKIHTVIALQNNIIINLTLDEVEKYKSIMKDKKKMKNQFEVASICDKQKKYEKMVVKKMKQNTIDFYVLIFMLL